MKIENSYSPLNTSDIEAFEKEIGHALPDAYRAFLLAHNGGEPEPSRFCYQERISDRLFESCNRVEVFLGIAEGEAYVLGWELESLKHRIPINFLPIARNGTGSVICISLYGDDEGSIYFWDAELESEVEGDYPDYYNSFLIADNFTDFLNGLTEECMFS